MKTGRDHMNAPESAQSESPTEATKGPSSSQIIEGLKALANPTRLRIMGWLSEPDLAFAAWEPIADREDFGVCVSHLQAKSGLAQSTISSYMATLERAGLVTSSRIGKWTHYKRDDNMVALLAKSISRS